MVILNSSIFEGKELQSFPLVAEQALSGVKRSVKPLDPHAVVTEQDCKAVSFFSILVFKAQSACVRFLSKVRMASHKQEL